MIRIILVLVLTFFLIPQSLAADETDENIIWNNPELPHELNLNVWIEQTKTDEMPWDGCPHTFMQSPIDFGLGLMGNAFQPSPPEIRLLILREDGSMTQHPNATCNDMLKCDFNNIPVNNEVVGFLLFDADASMRDLVDAMVLVPEKSRKWLDPAEKMREKMKEMVTQFTPQIPDLCRIHANPRKVVISPYSYDECPDGGGCALSQSTWNYTTGEPQPEDEWNWR